MAVIDEFPNAIYTGTSAYIPTIFVSVSKAVALEVELAPVVILCAPFDFIRSAGIGLSF